MQSQKRGKEVIKVISNSSNKINAITLAYTKQLGLQIRQTNVWTQKIDNSSLKTLEIVIASFQVADKLGKVLFF